MLDDGDLADAVLASLDDLLGALDLDRVGPDRFRARPAARATFDRIYGGQLLAQAVVGAGGTARGEPVHSLHASFVRAGDPGRPVEIEVTRVRDGRSMATRQVAVVQDGATLLLATLSFHRSEEEPDVSPAAPAAAAPDDTPRLQDWAHALPPEHERAGRHWIQRPPPVELRVPDAPTFLGGTATAPVRTHWIRLPRPVDGDDLLHAALLAFASDYLLMDMVFRAHPDVSGPGDAGGVSLDHAMWFHRRSQLDTWHLYAQEAVAVVGDRGLARGSIHDHGGRLVASVAQEVLVRAVRPG